MKVLLWHVHGAWTTAFVHGRHEVMVPVNEARDEDGRGRALTYGWPDDVREVTEDEVQDIQVDVVVLQRPAELDGLAQRWLGGRRPGRDIPAVYVEHNAPQGRISEMRHPAADRTDIHLVHVTHFNALFWDSGVTPTSVIEHGIVDPGYRYSGELPHAAVVINEAARRGRVTGTDLLPAVKEQAQVDLFGIGARAVGGVADLAQDDLHDAMALRRVYLHPFRWTSLGLSLLEAMHLGMPVVALATTEVPRAVPPGAGVITMRPAELASATRELIADPDRAREAGRAAREAALANYGLERFQGDWDALLEKVA